MPDPLGGQNLSLARDPTAVFLLWRRYPDHRTDAGLAAFVCPPRPNQRFSVDPAGLRPTASTRGRTRGGINDVALDPLALQHRCIQNPSNPASWMTMIGKLFPVRPRAFSLSCERRISSPATSTPGTEALRHRRK